MINSHMGRFLWNNNKDHHRYHLVHWQLVAQQKELGGLGIPDLRNLNLSLLGSWIFRYGLNRDAIWTKITDYKYKTDKPNICCSLGSQVSPFWKGVTWALQAAKMGIIWKVGDGKMIRFWEDHWFGNSNLATQFWPLYVLSVNNRGKQLAKYGMGKFDAIFY